MIATGLRADGHREVLGLDVGDSENESFWREFLTGLNDRGLAGDWSARRRLCGSTGCFPRVVSPGAGLRGIVRGVEVRRLEEHYKKAGESLVRFASTIVGPGDAEDVVARVMVSMLQSRAAEPTDLGAYLYRSVANAARQHWRSMDRRTRREALCRPVDRYEHHEFVPEVLAALAVLSPQQRAAIHLTYWEDLTPTAVADRLGVSDGTVRRQLARARHKLAEVLHEIR